MHPHLIRISILLAFAPGIAIAQAAPLSLAEVQAAALEHNPTLHAARAAAEAVAARRSAAGLPADPQLRIGVMNASLPGLRTDMPTSMAPSLQVMQMIPVPGTLGLQSALARQDAGRALSAAEEIAWGVRTRASNAFFAIYEVERRRSEVAETLDWLREVERITAALYASGSGRQSDVLRAGIEVARTEGELSRLAALRTAAAARLNAVLGRTAETPVPPVALPPLPAALPAQPELALWAAETRPLLEEGRWGLAQAETRAALARRELWPDLTVGVEYGQRPGSMGTERMGSVMLGFSVPVFARQRQLQLRHEATAMRQMAAAELEAMRAESSAEIAELVAELESARTLLRLFRGEVIPLAEANVESALSAYRVGRVDFLTLVDARTTLSAYRQERHALAAEYGALVARLEMAVGRELPAATEMMEVDA
jgi:outer membrane protein, heavy metal efflux system